MQAWQRRLQTLDDDLSRREATAADAGRDADARCAAAAAAEVQLKTLQQEHVTAIQAREEDMRSAEQALQKRMAAVGEREAQSCQLERELAELQEQVHMSLFFQHLASCSSFSFWYLAAAQVYTAVGLCFCWRRGNDVPVPIFLFL
jgi:hypothetical protein